MDIDIESLVRPTVDRGARWSVEVRDLTGDRVLASHDAEALLRTASVAKIFLLVVIAERIANGELDPHQLVDRNSVPPVADSGLWQHLATSRLPLVDVAILVGAVSDNWATNALLELVGVDAVQECARRLAPGGSVLLDHVRDERRPGQPPTLSEGCASDWTRVLAGLDDTVLGWLATGVDLSMVAASFGLDPLAHAESDRGVRLWNKTGTSDGVRADVGLVEIGGRRTAYAVLCTWPVDGPDLRDDVLAAMRGIGSGVYAATARRSASRATGT